MIRIGLITGLTDRCGITEYAKHLYRSVLDPEIQIVPLGIAFSQVLGHQPQKYSIIQMNESGFTMAGFDQNVVFRLKEMGIKTLLTCHASNMKNNKNPLTVLFDRVVVHEKDTEDGFDYIPQGAPVNPNRLANMTRTDIDLAIGTSGFPLGFKNMQRLAEATAQLDLGMVACAPESGHVDANRVAAECRARNSRAVIHTSWMEHQQIVDILGKCLATCYPYTNYTPGPSSAAMNGVASGRPTIVSRSNQFAHLFGKTDEFTFIESADPSVDDIKAAIETVLRQRDNGMDKLPTKTYEEMNWGRCAELYIKLYKDMVA